MCPPEEEVGYDEILVCRYVAQCSIPKIVLVLEGYVIKDAALFANVLQVKKEFLLELAVPVYGSKKVVDTAKDVMKGRGRCGGAMECCILFTEFCG